MTKVHTILIVAILALSAPARRTYAQAAGPSGSSRAMDVSMWVGAGHDRQLDGSGSDAAVGEAPAAPTSNWQLGLGVTYARLGKRGSLNADVRSGLHAESVATRNLSLDHQASVRGAFSFSRRTGMELTQAGKYMGISPFFAALPSDPGTLGTPLGAEQRFRGNQALTSTTSTVLTHALSRRSAFVLLHGVTYAGTGDGRSVHGQTFGARVDRQLSPSQTLRLGYRHGFSTPAVPGGTRLSTHDLDSGLDYARPLPFSRRTMLSAGTGSSLVSDGVQRTVRLLANVGLSHQFAPRWQARLEFGRPVQVMEGVAVPVIATSSVAAALDGAIGRKMGLTASGGFVDGAVNLDAAGGDNKVRSYSASLQWRIALNRRISWQTDVFYGRSQFGAAVVLPSAVPSHIQRAGVRVLLTYGAPVLRN